MSRVLAAGSAAALIACLSLQSIQPASSTEQGDTQERRPGSQSTDGRVLHRVVWDQYKRDRRGIHLRSARRNGTDVRRGYDSRRGFTMDLTLNRTGRRVAFATCCTGNEPALVVARVRGGTPLTPLHKHPEIDFVGGIGWSPDGQRLAFEGTTGTWPDRTTALWTIRPDGTDLEQVLDLGPVNDDTVINEALVWTEAGILYTDEQSNLRLTSAGESTLIMRRVFSVRISGDGRSLIITRGRHVRRSVWISTATGTNAQRLFVQGDPGNSPTFYDVTPNYDASRLLAYRMGVDGGDAIVTWRTKDKPAASASIVDAIGYSPTATWN